MPQTLLSWVKRDEIDSGKHDGVTSADAQRMKEPERENKKSRPAGIAEFRWHDLRHTGASWHVQGGTPLFALQELGGWETTSIVRRYAHLAADHLAAHADRMTGVCGTNLVQVRKEQGLERAQALEVTGGDGGLEPSTYGL